MREYFSQFGTITKLRLSRNRRTGASKHFAFIEFESDDVARIVAKTMDNYLMFGHILKCKYASQGSLHPDIWKGANKRFKVVPFLKLEKRALEAPKTAEKWNEKISREEKRRKKKAEKLKEIGYEMKLPKITKPEEVFEKRKLAITKKPEVVVSPTGDSAPAPPIEAHGNKPKDEAAVKSSKPGKMTEKLQTESTRDSCPASPATGSGEKDAQPEPKTRKRRKGKKENKAEMAQPDAQLNAELLNVAAAAPTLTTALEPKVSLERSPKGEPARTEIIAPMDDSKVKKRSRRRRRN